MTPLPVTVVLRDAMSRARRAREALADGDTGFAEQVLDDLVDDLWRQVERLERQERSS